MGLVITVVAVAFEGLAVTTVMPNAVRDLGGLAAYGWTFSAFMLTNLVGITVAGERTDASGPRAPFAAGLALFGLGLAGGSAAPSSAALIAARAVQGFGGGTLQAVVYACVARGYPAERQPRMLAVLSTAWVVPGLIGPGLAGIVADRASWRLVFAGLLPFVGLAAALTLPALRELAAPASTPRVPRPGQIGSASLLAMGTVAFLLGLEGRTPWPLLPLALGAATAAAGVRRLMPAGTLRARAGLPAAVAAMFLVSVAFFGAETLLPLMVTTLRGQSATAGGVILSGATFAWTAGAWLQAREAPRRGRGVLVGAGAGVLAAGIAVVGLLIVPTASFLVGPVGWALAGLGMGLAHTTISLTVVEQASPGEEGASTASMQLAGVLGVAVGAGVGGALVTGGALGAGGAATGFASALLVMCTAALATLAMSQRLPRSPLGPRPQAR